MTILNMDNTVSPLRASHHRRRHRRRRRRRRYAVFGVVFAV